MAVPPCTYCLPSTRRLPPISRVGGYRSFTEQYWLALTGFIES
jgi:hypothetical protein